MGRHGLSPQEAGRVTPREYALYAKSYQVKMQEWRYKASFLAWQNQTVQATRGSGKNVRSKYTTFNDFYDYEKELEAIFNKKTTSHPKNSMAELNKKLNERR